MKTKILLLAIIFLPLYFFGQTDQDKKQQNDQRINNVMDSLIRKMNIDDGRPTCFTSRFSDKVQFFPIGPASASDPTKSIIYDDATYGIIAQGQGPGPNNKYYFVIDLSKLHENISSITISYLRNNTSDEIHIIPLPHKRGYLEFAFFSSCGTNIQTEKINEGVITFDWRKRGTKTAIDAKIPIFNRDFVISEEGLCQS